MAILSMLVEQGWDGRRFRASPSRSFLQIFCKPFAIQDNQLIQDLIPVPISLRPFLRYIRACQIQHFFKGRVAWKHALCLGHFSVLAVQSFYDVRGIHNPANVIRELEVL